MGAAVGAGGTAWLARRWVRHRRLAAVPLLLIVLVGTTGTMLAIGTAQRTSTAFARHLERSNVADVVVNPSVSSTEADALIRSLPGVTEVTTDALFAVTADDGAPRPRGELEAGDEEPTEITFVFGSHDGRYVDADRPVVEAGRLPTGPAEVALSAAAARAMGFEIGDVVPLAFWPSGVAPAGAEAVAAYWEEVVEPIGVEQVTIVGLTRMTDEVLPNELYSRHRVILSPDIARRYDCLPPPPDPALSLAENIAIVGPDDCAVSYRYYSLSFADGAAGVKPALEEFVRRVQPINAELATIDDPTGLGSGPPQYFLIATETDPERQRVERAIRPTVTAMAVLGLAAAAVTVAVAGVAVWREVRRTATARRQWDELGVTPRARAVVVLIPLLAAVALGAVGALVATWLLGTRPIGIVSVLEPARTRGVGGAAVVALVAIAVAVALVTVALVAAASRRSDGATGGHDVGPGTAMVRIVIGPPAFADGVRAALGHHRAALPAVAGTAVVGAAVVAALVFGANLTRLIDSPPAYGWPWDVAAITGGGYGDLDLPAARDALDGDPAVEAWTAFGFLNEMSLDGEPMMSVAGIDRDAPEVGFAVLSGVLPSRDGEIALGANTARQRGLDVGDTAVVGGGPDGASEVVVTGLVVFPAVGPLLADAVGGGNGMLLPQAMFDGSSQSQQDAADLATFVGVDFADSADDADVARITERLGDLDLQGVPPAVYRRPVRPPEVISAASAGSVPLAVGASFAAVGAVGFGVATWAAVRARRRELAVLRAIGFDRSQVRWSVRAQSLTVVVAALVVGVPFGILAGRLAWTTFARQLGVVPDASSGWAVVAVVCAVALLVGVAVAEVPARRAMSSRPAAALRSE